MKIVPAILTNNKSTFNKLVDEADTFVDRLHIDFVDGEYADNLTLEPIDVEVTRYLSTFDAHLMVTSHNLEDWLTEVVKSGFERIVVQVESVVGQAELISKIQKKGKEAGLALDIETPVSKISDEAFELANIILVMGVEAGYDGQKFHQESLEKVKALKKVRDSRKLSFTICVDGGVTSENIKSIYDAGADEIVVGKRVFTPDLTSNLDLLKSKLL